VIVQRRLEPSRPFALNAENPHRFPAGSLFRCFLCNTFFLTAVTVALAVSAYTRQLLRVRKSHSDCPTYQLLERLRVLCGKSRKPTPGCSFGGARLPRERGGRRHFPGTDRLAAHGVVLLIH